MPAAKKTTTRKAQAKPATNAANGASSDSASGPAPISPRRFAEFIDNILSRSRLAGELLDPRRDINHECGYPESNSYIPPEFYQELYDRDAIAARVVEIWPKESWKVQPLVYEDENAKTATPFEQGWDDLGRSLRGKGWHAQEEGSPVWEYLCRADVLSGVGQYGVILLGLDDGADLRQPAEFDPGPSANRKLLYLRTFPESVAQITRLDPDPRSERFGQPVEYLITFNDPREGGRQSAVGVTTMSLNVHWTRVVHVADNLASSEVFGVPRMRPVLNRLLDLVKIYAADGEGFWRNSILKLFLETHPELGGDVDINQSVLRDDFEQMMNGLQQWMTLRGMSAKSVPPSVVDPGPHVDKQIEAVCVQIGVPIRKFRGSERGELASTQDEGDWNDRVLGRHLGYLTPRVVVPFVDRCIQLNVLPEPRDGYFVDWPDMTAAPATEKADVLVKRTQAMAAYVGGSVESLMPPMDYLTREAGYDEEEAKAILESAEELAAEREEEEAQEQRELIERGMVADPMEPKEPKVVSAGAGRQGEGE